MLGETDLALDVESVNTCKRELCFLLLFLFLSHRVFSVKLCLKVVDVCGEAVEPHEAVHADHSDSHYSGKSGNMLYIIFFHRRPLCVDYQQSREEAELLGTVAFSVTFALFDGILD